MKKDELLRQFNLSSPQIEVLLRKYEAAVKSGVPFVICDTRHLQPEQAMSDFLAANASTSFGAAFTALERCEMNDGTARTVLLFKQDAAALHDETKQTPEQMREQEQFEQYNEQLQEARLRHVPLVTFDARHLSLKEYKKQFARFELLTCSFGALAALARKGVCRAKVLRSPEVLAELKKKNI